MNPVCALNSETVDGLNDLFHLIVVHGLMAGQAKATGVYMLGDRQCKV